MNSIALGAGVFHHGDCFDVMRGLPDASVDMILCDLPYGTTQNAWDSVLDLQALFGEYRRICTGAIILTAQTPFDKVLGASQIALLKYEWVWEKTAATGFMNAKKMPLKAHENVLVFYNFLPIFNPQKTNNHKRIKVSGARALHGANYAKSTANRGEYDSTDRYPRSVIEFPKDNRLTAFHPTQKPVALFEYLIRTYTNSGAVVLDNCAGSGTTAIAAQRTGRRWICIEKDDTYAALAIGRIAGELDA